MHTLALLLEALGVAVGAASLIVGLTSYKTQALPVLGRVMRVLDRLSAVVHRDANGTFQLPLFARSVTQAVLDELRDAPMPPVLAPTRETRVPPPLLALVALSLAGAATLQGCGGSALQVQARMADTLARATNAALPVLAERYESGGNAAIDRGGQPALDAHIATWRPVWGACGAVAAEGCAGGAWHALRAAQGAWVDAIERQRRGAPTDSLALLRLAGSLRVAWCSLRAALPPPSPLPDVPGLTCEVPDAR
jgi:hypothetical protein